MADWTRGATGAVSGASTGASFGSVFPGLGTGVGALAGGLFGGLAGLYGQKKKKQRRISTLDNRQRELNRMQHQAILGEGPLADMYNYDPERANEVFDKSIADPAYRKFKEDLAPQITGQFRKQGLMDSSYSGDALSKLSRDIQESLDAQRGQYLYGEQKEARSTRRGAVESMQDRPTFALDTSVQDRGGFDVDRFFSSITPEVTDQIANYFRRPQTMGAY